MREWIASFVLDYRTMDGVLVPFLIEWSRADYQVTFRFAEVKHNITR